MSIFTSVTSEYNVNNVKALVALDAQVTCALLFDLLASNSLRQGDRWSPASCKFMLWGIVS
jgi:hypothetical protein